MDKKLKAKWLKALKSERYAKGEGQMCIKRGHAFTTDAGMCVVAEHDMFCCLGVLCEIANVPYKATSGGTESQDAPVAVIGLPQKHAAILAALNDNAAVAIVRAPNRTTEITVRQVKNDPKDFRRVIKYIEKNL